MPFDLTALYPAPCHFATVALVLTPVLSGLAILLPLLRQNQQSCMQLLKIQNLMECRAVETTATADCDTSSK
jgi:hypothetical protein